MDEPINRMTNHLEVQIIQEQMKEFFSSSEDE